MGVRQTNTKRRKAFISRTWRSEKNILWAVLFGFPLHCAGGEILLKSGCPFPVCNWVYNGLSLHRSVDIVCDKSEVESCILQAFKGMKDTIEEELSTNYWSPESRAAPLG